MYRFAGIAAALATVTFAAPMHAAPITDLKETATWKTGAAGVRSERAGITFPIQAGVLRFLSAGKNDSNELDLNAQYASEDGGIVGTVFLYRPTLPDNGLAYLATNEAIVRRGDKVRQTFDGLVDIDGIKNAGRKIAYANFLPELPTSYAMFIQAGPWMIVLRVSAKAGREDDAERAIDVLAAEASFDKGSEPVEARVINVESCGQQLPMKSAGMAKPATAEVATLAALADGVIHDDKGHSVKEAIGRVPNRLCLISNDSFNGHPRMTFITMEDGGPIMRPAVFQLYGDAGIIVEITALQKGPQRFYAVRNAIGSAVIAGTFDQIPSAGQLEAIFNRGPSIPLVAMAESDGKTSRQTIDCSLTKEGCAAGE